MADRIEDLLQRRTDLSTFLIHLTRDTKRFTARENLVSILSDQRVSARRKQGMAKDLAKALDGTVATQRVVCFSETPLEHAWMMVRDIEHRTQSFKPYGVVFTKTTCRRRGCNPVWYLDITTATSWLTVPVTSMVDQAVELATDAKGNVDDVTLAAQPIFRLTPFIEQMGNPSGKRKEFWWEREWRHAGDFAFHPKQVVAVLAPESEHLELRDEIKGLSARWDRRAIPLLDASWGLERMIAAMSRIGEDDIGPWPD